MLEGGYHFIVDLEGCDPRRLDSRRAMLSVCRDIARLMQTRVLTSAAQRFHPQGVTAFVVIAESHISVHTWPESKKAFLDVFTCKERVEGERILEFAVAALGAKRARLAILLRSGMDTRVLPGSRIPIATFQVDFGAPIYQARSRFQRIELTRGPLGLSLFLDGYWQFVERYEHVYHESLVHPALVCSPGLRRVGICGGGDGLALREVLRYPQLGKVAMYELDPAMIRLARSHPEMVRLNRGSLDDSRAVVVPADARKLLKPGAAFDALILDFPSISDGTRYAPLYSVALYQRAKRALAPGGMLVTQATDWPRHLARTIENVRRVFPHVLPIRISVDGSTFTYVAASERRMRQRRPLPGGLRFLTQKRLAMIMRGKPLVVAERPRRARVA